MDITNRRIKIVSFCYSIFVTRPLYWLGQALRVLTRHPRRLEPIDPARVRSIAILRLDLLGDFVIFTSALRGLRERFPHARITLFMTAWVAPIASLCPYADEIVAVPVPAQKWRQFLFGPFRMVRLARQKLLNQFDLVINARHDRDTAGAGILAHFSLAPQILGFPERAEQGKALYNRGSDGFYTHLLPITVEPHHESELNQRILRYLGVSSEEIRPELWLSSADHDEASRLLRDAGWEPGDCLICLGIHAGGDRKLWPMERFRELLDRIARVAAFKFLVVGSKANWPEGEALRGELGPSLINIAGKAALRVSAAAIARTELYLGNDSGPMHIAAALGKPVIAITCHPRDGDRNHHQSPVRWAPLASSLVLLSPRSCLAPCTGSCDAAKAHCIRQVAVQEVFEAFTEVLKSTQANRLTPAANAL